MASGFLSVPAFEQAAIIVLLIGLMAIFALDRFRIELVALCGLAIGFILGLVPAGSVFSGFANPAVITVAEILLIVQALGRSQVVERFATRLLAGVRTQRAALALVCAIGAALSTVMNNFGALALMLPVVVGLGARLGVPLQQFLMPLSFATLLGGLCTLVGTPANLVVSQVSGDLLGTTFALFDLTPTGLAVAIAGIPLLVALAPRLLRGAGRAAPQPAPQAAPQPDPQAARKVVTELTLRPDSAFAGRTVAQAEAALAGQVFTVQRGDARLFGRADELTLEAGDVLTCEIPSDVFEAQRQAGALVRGPERRDGQTAELVVTPQSIFVGSRVGRLGPFLSHDIAVVGVVPQRPRVEGGLADLKLSIGDILIVQGDAASLREAADDTGLLRLSSDEPAPPTRPGYAPLITFLAGLLSAGLGLAPLEVCFGVVVLVLSLTGQLDLREGLRRLNWPALVMLAAMIPLGAAVETTGAARLLSFGLVALLPDSSPLVPVGAVLLVAVALTPFLNNVSTAVVLSPIAVEIARAAALPPEPFLIAVALGASLDFLTPFGHHNNTLVMGMAGYRFIDFPRLGAPLLALSYLVALAAIALFWL